MFKGYLENQLETTTKGIEQKAMVNKEVAQLKFKGNQKKFELNGTVDAILENMKQRPKNPADPKEAKLVKEYA